MNSRVGIYLNECQITLLGQSHGGHVVLMTAFSPGISEPGEKRPFNSVISMSGNSGLVNAEQTVERSHAVAKELGCEGSAREIMNCMRRFDTEAIVAATFKVHGPDAISGKGPKGITFAGELFPIRNEREFRENRGPIRLMIGSTIFEVFGEPTGEDRVNRVLGIENRKECLEKYRNDLGSGIFGSNYDEVSQEIVVTSNVYAKYIAEIGGEAYLYEYDNPVHGLHTQDADLVLGLHEYEKNEDEVWLSRAYPRYFANFINGKRPAYDWSPVNPQLMNYYSINRNRSDNVYPHMENGKTINVKEAV
ncbi:hypothetical protein PMAYCL1PPCAC_27742 [Pristionchus mayeri]|uniref:Carboxylesterase type B domain-containing protein n=1 Tax=Pristionchus mayeri TaxID=1317129 RepID=A0AAN5D898_9BILA|nr:hypothetical protein PMAYCL1PPCAC_27742 [Pristionchus mayeri]